MFWLKLSKGHFETKMIAIVQRWHHVHATDLKDQKMINFKQIESDLEPLDPEPLEPKEPILAPLNPSRP